MFTKVLIANRGAIAHRIIRTLKTRGILAVAVYADSDADSLHVRHADEAHALGAGGAADTYLNIKALIDIATRANVDAIHPGYGFLSENPSFVECCEGAGITFIGPAAHHMHSFALKHRARELARDNGIPLLPGSNLIDSADSAVRQAEAIGFPVMMKSSAGGGGIGMQACHDEAALREAYASVKRLGGSHFANDALFIEKYIERARHIEVQVFGDGNGNVVALGDRDCSAQRRHQKVLEECPAPALSTALRQALQDNAVRLLAAVEYRNAGTVEFIVDAASESFHFLEVNTRLQVEHGVTEAVFGVDLVDWMLRVASDDPFDLRAAAATLESCGHAVQVRLYAEDPYRQFRPSAGRLSDVHFPVDEAVRIDTWVETGCEISAYFDPMIAKVIAHGTDRESALERLQSALSNTRLYGCETNLSYLRSLLQAPVVRQARVTTRFLESFHPTPQRMDVRRGGTQTTVQDGFGRQGYWAVGVPPSGPFDALSFALGNRLVGNLPAVAGLEFMLEGPELYFSVDTFIVIAGADFTATIDDEAIASWTRLRVPAGATLSLGRVGDTGMRGYLCIQGGIACPEYLGSRSTFTLGQFGGHDGRALRSGDVLPLTPDGSAEQVRAEQLPAGLPPMLRPAMAHTWTLHVTYGPHGAPDFFTAADIDTLFDTDWEVHYQSSRTGVRLIGPKPEWARTDGGEAGMHPSNIHDTAYAFGTVDFTGDMPVILGPDGPSLGGFVCPATVIAADLWKLGQLRAGDTLRFRCVDQATAVEMRRRQKQAIEESALDVALPEVGSEAYEGRQSSGVSGGGDVRHIKDVSEHGSVAATASESMSGESADSRKSHLRTAILATLTHDSIGEDVVYRAAGDNFLLIEYGAQTLEIALRFRVHALMGWLDDNPLAGTLDITPGVRSLQVRYDSLSLTQAELLEHLQDGETHLHATLSDLSVPSRIVHLPLSWDDPVCRQAIDKYVQTVRPGAPWCPSNLDFIRRINGLESMDAVRDIVFDAAYLVLGLGDVYLGAPVATPIDPRQRLVTTKYNPARTWTAENSVGIGGAYLCVYGMEGPGGYQFVGRTVQMWNRYRRTPDFQNPWLLRCFDQIRFHPVASEELLRLRRDFPTGRHALQIEHTTFSLSDHQAWLDAHRDSIDRFTARRNAAFEAELARWHVDGQFSFEAAERDTLADTREWPDGSTVIESPVAGSVWQARTAVDDVVDADDVLIVLESMKMELEVCATAAGTVSHVLHQPGERVEAGQALVVLAPCLAT